LSSIFGNATPLRRIGLPKQGLATGENDRFLKLWHEVNFAKIGFSMQSREQANKSTKRWFPCNKGGSFRKWYGNNDYIVNWENDGQEIREFKDNAGKLRSRPQNMEYYFRDGLTWSTLSSANLSMRYSPIGHLFETKGSVCFFNDKEKLLYCLGLMNSIIVNKMLLILCPTLDFHEGPVGKFLLSGTK
jgi:hypothetical protein